jgi:hypothetical protein
MQMPTNLLILNAFLKHRHRRPERKSGLCGSDPLRTGRTISVLADPMIVSGAAAVLAIAQQVTAFSLDRQVGSILFI